MSVPLGMQGAQVVQSPATAHSHRGLATLTQSALKPKWLLPTHPMHACMHVPPAACLLLSATIHPISRNRLPSRPHLVTPRLRRLQHALLLCRGRNRASQHEARTVSCSQLPRGCCAEQAPAELAGCAAVQTLLRPSMRGDASCGLLPVLLPVRLLLCWADAVVGEAKGGHGCQHRQVNLLPKQHARKTQSEHDCFACSLAA